MALFAGGGAMLVAAGSAMLYHILRATDVNAGRPVWHHFEQDRAGELVSAANAPR